MLILEDNYIKASGYSEEELKLEIAIMLFEKEKLSLRMGAALAGMHLQNLLSGSRYWEPGQMRRVRYLQERQGSAMPLATLSFSNANSLACSYTKCTHKWDDRYCHKASV